MNEQAQSNNGNLNSPPHYGGGRERVSLSIAAFVSAIIFAGAGMWIPPQGVIDGSVLILVAQLLVLCATFLGIKDFNLPQKR